MKRVIFYFDGFNFYNGLKDICKEKPNWKNYYWIDLFKFCSQFVFEGSELVSVKYFTAPPKNEQKRSKQSALFGANKLLNKDNVLIYTGHYTTMEVECFAKCKQTFTVPVEKCTDVNLALTIISDCIDDLVDTIVLVTADSDQLPTIKMVKQKFPKKKMKVYFPPNRISNDIRGLIGQVVFLENHEEKFKAAMMPGEVILNGKKYTKPKDWKV